MTVLTRSQSLFLGRYYDLGFRIHEPDDHALELSYRGERFGAFSQIAATEEAVRDACQEYLACHSGQRDAWLRERGWA